MQTNKILKPGMLVFLSLLGTMAFGQEAEAQTPAYQMTLATLIYVFSIILLFIAVAIWRIAIHLKRYIKNEFKEEQEEVSQPFWERFFQVKSVKTDKDTIIDHPHDGIYELDNPAPPWFMWLFYLTVLFAVIYVVRFSFTEWGYTQAEEYEEEMAIAAAEQADRLEKEGSSVDENTVVFQTDEINLSKGKRIYDGNCKVCHGDYGQGATGPNFTDSYYLHGGSIQSIFKTIKYGVVEKGMISWESQLGPSAMQQVASYVKSLQGTTLPEGVKGKDPQGEVYIEEIEVEPVDSLNIMDSLQIDRTISDSLLTE